MPISFTDAFGVDKKLFEETGAFDPILNVDSKLFIDPALLPETSCPEFVGAWEEMEHFFSGIIALLRNADADIHRFWKKADKKLTFKEIRGTCLGYSERSIAGNSIGPRLRKQILRAVKDLDDAGANDPIIFEMIGVFEEGVGCDRISDLLTYKLIDRICRFTVRVMGECNFAGPTISHREHLLPLSPFSDTPVLLLPKDILHPLPLAKKFEDLAEVCRENERVRDNVNKWFKFDGGAKPSKKDIFDHMRKDEEFRAAYIQAYKDAEARKYDFSSDPDGEIIWYESGKTLASQYPLWLSAQSKNKQSLYDIVRKITLHFKRLVESEGKWELLFNEDRITPRKERTSQHLFASIASAYCVANDIDMSPEANSGNGPVDFKFSTGYSKKVLVELKLSSNTQLNHCIDKQIPIYMKQEDADKAIYLLINTGNDKKVKAFRELYNDLDTPTKKKIELIVVDAKPKKSASVA